MWVKLTDMEPAEFQERQIYVNLDAAQTLQRVVPSETAPYTTITFDVFEVEVEETPEDILKAAR